MSELDDRQMKALHDIRRSLLRSARIFSDAAERFEVAVLSIELAARKEADTPDGWQLPKDKQLTVSATNARRRVEAVGESWQIGDHEFSDEWEEAE